MNIASITFFQVGNGNCCLINVGDVNMVFDLKGTDDKVSFDLLKPYFKKRNGKFYLDVLCISHGDKDHCGGFSEFKKWIDKGKLVIGSIWHPNYDRTKIENRSDLPEDYIKLYEEIMRRRKKNSDDYGHIEIPLTAWDEEEKAFKGLNLPNNTHLKVLSPYVKDENDTGWDVNDISLVLNIEIYGLSILFPGDSGCDIWKNRIIPYTLESEKKKTWAKASILVAPHHGSYKFFGNSREEVRDADPLPDNFESLEFICPEFLLLSASSVFPTSRDKSGDDPPHYAAYKWYFKWFKEKYNLNKDIEHPSRFKYTANGHIRLEYDGKEWKWINNWAPNDDNGTGKGFIYKKGETRREGGRWAKGND